MVSARSKERAVSRLPGVCCLLFFAGLFSWAAAASTVGTADAARAPRVAVLLHGAVFPLTPGNGSPAFPRRYFSRDFVAGLLLGGGDEEDGARLATLSGVDLSTGAAWLEDGVATGEPADRFLAPAPIAADSPPPLSALLPSRNGTRGFLEQTKAAVAELDSLDRWYEDRFGVAPEYVFIGHSMGGLVARFLLTNPDPAAFAGDPLLNPDGVRFTAEERAAMDRLRSRCLLLVTLGTPHEGTRIADNADRIAGRLRGVIDQALGERPADDAAAGVIARAVEGLARDLRSAQTRDLTRAYWLAMNRGPLRPDRLARPDGTQIPVHAFCGRRPGGKAFATLEPGRNLKSLLESDRAVLVLGEVFAEMSQKALGGWGEVDPFVHGDYAARLDETERITFAGLLRAATGVELDRRLIDAFGPDLGRAAAAKLGFLETALPVYLDQRHTIRMTGRWTVPVPYLVCTAIDSERLGAESRRRFGVALDQADLEEALRRAFGDFKTRVAAIEGLSLESVLEALRAAGALSEDSARAIAELAKEGVRAAAELVKEFGPGAARCVDPRNWVVRYIEVDVPAPEPVPTGEPAADGEIDADGPVPVDSALGLFLGTAEAGAYGDGRDGGTWHRHFDGPFAKEGHVSQTKGRDLGAFLGQRFLRE